MKTLFLFSLLFISAFVHGQNDSHTLQKEAASFGRGDTVLIFGNLCDCELDRYSRYYLFTSAKAEYIVFNDESGKNVRIFDSSFECPDCQLISDYVVNNFDTVFKQMANVDFLLHSRKEGNHIMYYTASHMGPCYLVGMYTPERYKYVFFEKGGAFNRLFKKGNCFWTFFNLLRNQWPRIQKDSR